MLLNFVSHRITSHNSAFMLRSLVGLFIAFSAVIVRFYATLRLQVSKGKTDNFAGRGYCAS